MAALGDGVSEWAAGPLGVKTSDYVFLVRPETDEAAEAWRSYYLPWPSEPVGLLEHPALISSTECGVDLPHLVEVSQDEVCAHEASGTFIPVDFGVRVICVHTGSMCSSGFAMVPRSSLTKSRFRLGNSPATFDPTYRGTVRARLDVLPSSSTRGSKIKLGASLLQLISPDMGGANVILVSHDAPESTHALFGTGTTARGAGGFGSTGAGGTSSRAGEVGDTS